MLVDVVPGADLHDLAQVHHGDPVGDVPDDRQVVRDEQVGQPELVLQVLQQVDHTGLHRHVQRGHRFVQDQQLRVQRQRPGDTDPLALAAGELVPVTVAVLGVETDELAAVRATRSSISFSSPILWIRNGSATMSLIVQRRIQRRVGVLEDDLHVPAHRPQVRVRHGGQLLAVEPHRAGRRLVQLQDGPAGGGFPAAGFADQAERLARIEVSKLTPSTAWTLADRPSERSRRP